MSNEIARPNKPDDDDGFGGSRRTGRRPRNFLKWDDVNRWRDRDGLPPPDVMLLVGITEFLQRWTKDGDKNVPTTIEDSPLPDLKMLNESIPAAEWPVGRDGKTEPPFKHYVGFTLVNPATGTMYFYSNSTMGAHKLYDDMDDAVITMRAMRGTKCVPVVKLSQRPMPTKKFGKIMRPDFEILDWRTLGGGGGGGDALPAQSSTPQLTGPAIAPTPTAPTPPPPTTLVSPPAQPQAKRPISLSDYTLAVMGKPKPVTTEELLNDSLEALPWDEK